MSQHENIKRADEALLSTAFEACTPSFAVAVTAGPPTAMFENVGLTVLCSGFGMTSRSIFRSAFGRRRLAQSLSS